MKYFEIVSKFWRINKTDTLGASAIALYNLLIFKWFESRNTEFKISDNEVTRNLNLSYKTIRSARLSLSKQGLIKFNTKNGLPCTYDIITDFKVDVNANLSNPKKKILKKKAHEKKMKSKLNNTISVIENIGPTIVQNILNENSKIPTSEEFLEYAQSLETYSDDLKVKILEKYDIWRDNEWRSEANRPITNWSKTIKSILPYLLQSSEDAEKEIVKIPKIKRSNLIIKDNKKK